MWFWKQQLSPGCRLPDECFLHGKNLSRPKLALMRASICCCCCCRNTLMSLFMRMVSLRLAEAYIIRLWALLYMSHLESSEFWNIPDPRVCKRCSWVCPAASPEVVLIHRPFPQRQQSSYDSYDLPYLLLKLTLKKTLVLPEMVISEATDFVHRDGHMGVSHLGSCVHPWSEGDFDHWWEGQFPKGKGGVLFLGNKGKWMQDVKTSPFRSGSIRL